MPKKHQLTYEESVLRGLISQPSDSPNYAENFRKFQEMKLRIGWFDEDSFIFDENYIDDTIDSDDTNHVNMLWNNVNLSDKHRMYLRMKHPVLCEFELRGE